MLILSLIFILSLSITSQGAFIEPITSTPLRPFSINRDYITDYSFSINVPSTIDSKGSFEVEFPLPYQLPSTCSAYLKALNNPFAKYTCEKVSSSKYVIDVGEIVSGEYQIVFENIKNPFAYPASSNFKIRTYFNRDVLIDANEYFEAVPFLPTPAISNQATVRNLGYTTVNLGSKFDFTFTLTKGISKGDSIKFNFPQGFYFVSPTCFHRESGSYTPTETLFNNRMVICQGFEHEMSANVQQTVTIIGVMNPDHSGFFHGFSLETMAGLSPNIYEKVIVLPPVRIDAGLVSITVKSENLLRSANTTHQIDLIFNDKVVAGNEVWIKIPPDFRYLADNCTFLRPLQAEPKKTLSCGLAPNKTGYIITNFAEIGSGQLLTIQVISENPALPANYTIEAFSYSPEYKAKVDYGFTSIIIDDKFGSSKYYNSHALKWTRRLKHSETGPLEFTFFLNVPLPATTSTFEGKIVIDIRPQIPDPGNVTCFFYQTVKTDCTYDTSDPELTKLTIYTPSTDPYYQTDIPITITTEGNEGSDGLRLPDLIQRYKFYIYFFRNKQLAFHEVFYDNYVPDPIIMDETWVTPTFAPLQYEEESYLRIAWINKYLELGTNYFFELEFDHRNSAWDFNLGWPVSEWYQKYPLPCLVEGLGQDYKCILRPGGGLNTISAIQIIGLSSIPKAAPGSPPPTAIFHFPKIKFGRQGEAFLKFGLYQNTPGEDTLRIPILYRDLIFQPKPQRTLTTRNDLSINLQPTSKVNETTNLVLSFQSTLKPDFVLYEYPEDFGLKTSIVPCGGSNKCFVFADGINWIVFDTPSNQGNTILISPSVITPPYVGSFIFNVRTVKNDGSVDEKIQGSVSTTSGKSTVRIDSSPLNPEINRYSLLIFDIVMNTLTYLPDNGSLIIGLSGLTVPDIDHLYCKTAGLVALDAQEIICGRYSSNSYRVYNIKAVEPGTIVTLSIQAQTSTTTTLAATVYTYYTYNDQKLVDTGSGSLTLTFQYSNFYNVDIMNNKSGEIVRAGKTGIINIELTPDVAITAAAVTFAPGFEQTSTRDVPMCRSNKDRKYCTYTGTNPLEVTVDTPGTAATLASKVLTNLSITTEYSLPREKGIKSPASPGWYPIKLTLTGPTDQESFGDFLYVYPSLVPEFFVEAVPVTANQAAMYTFTFKLSSVVLNSNTDANTRGRIFIDFPIGEGMFQTDLGTGKKTGEYLGCNVEGLIPQESIHCRLIQSPGVGTPSSVEIVGFSRVVSPTQTTIVVRVAKIKNPETTIGENVFILRTEHLDVATNKPTPLEYTTFSLWHQVKPLKSNVKTVQSPAPSQFQADSVLGQVNRRLETSIYSTVSLSAGDYYIYELPSEIRPNLVLTPPAGVDLCFSFPEAGWVVLRLSNSLVSSTPRQISIQSVTIPSDFPQTGYQMQALVWKDNELVERVQSNTAMISGSIKNVVITPEHEPLVRNRINTEFVIEFTVENNVPRTGSIEIRFPSGFKPHANCHNIAKAGSKLKDFNGKVACSVQGTSWILTNFDDITGGSEIKVYGLIDLPNVSGETESLEIHTYTNQNNDLKANGRKIDEIKTGNTFTISDWNTLSLDTTPTTLVNQLIVARNNNYHPLIFEFTLTNSITASSSTLEIYLDTSTGAFGGIRTDARTICYFINMDTSENIACEYTFKNSGATGIDVFELTPLKNLNSNTQYRCIITTAFAEDGNDGIIFPSRVGIYKAAIRVQGTDQQVDLSFIEIFPNNFSSLTVKNYMISKPDDDIIEIDLQVPGTISSDNRIIIELPTVFNNTAMFDEDLGQSLEDGQDKVCDVISSTPASISMSCFFQKGNRIAGTPATIIVYNINKDFSQLRFAFTVKSPTLSSSTIIPLTIYTIQGTKTFTKTYYQRVEQAIIVLNSAPETSQITAAPTYSTQTLKSSSTLGFSFNPSFNLGTSDSYILKTPKMSSSAVSRVSNVNIPNFGSAQAVILSKLGYVIVKPSTPVTSTSVFTASIPDVYTPDTFLDQNERGFTGFVAYFSRMETEKVTYTTPATQFQGITSFASSPTVSASSLIVNQNSVLTFTLRAVYQNIESIIVQLGSQVQIGVDCYEGVDSAIPILSCSTDQDNNSVLIILEKQNYPTSPQNLRFNVKITNGANTGSVSAFGYKLYTSIQTDPAVTSDLVYSVNASPNIQLQSSSQGGGQVPTYIEFGYVPYVENNNGNDQLTNRYADISFGFEIETNLASGNVVEIRSDSFDFVFSSQTFGDVRARPAVIVETSSVSVLAIASYNTQANTLTFTVPSTLSSQIPGGTIVTLRITQIGIAGDIIGVRTDVNDNNQYTVDMNVYLNNNQQQNNQPKETRDALPIQRVVKVTNPSRAPIRVKFELSSSLSANTGTIALKLPENQFRYDTSSDLNCFMRRYRDSGTISTETAATCTIAGTLSQGYTITATTGSTLAANNIYELIIETTNTNNPHFDKLTGASEQVLISFRNGNINLAFAVIDVFEYKPSPSIEVTKFYYTSSYSNNANTIIFQLEANEDVSAFPNSLIEFEITSANNALIKSDIQASDRELKCGIIGLSTRDDSTSNLRCVFIATSPPRVRIENYNAIDSGSSFSIVFYDLDNSVIAGDSFSYFSGNLIVTDTTTQTQSQHKLTRLFAAQTGNGGSSSPESRTLTTSSTNYGASSTLSAQLTWNNANSCTNCRIIGQGIDLPWKFESGNFELQIDNNSENMLIDSVNNIFIVLNPSEDLTQGTYRFEFQGSNVRNPLSYELTSSTIQLEFISNKQDKRTINLSYPTLSVPSTASSPTIQCSSLGNLKVGKGGNIDCVVTFSLQSDNLPIAGALITFPNPGNNEFSEVHPYCDAFLSSSNPLKSHLICSRQESDSNQASFFFTGFPQGTGNSLSFTFRARALASTISADVYLQTLYEGQYYNANQIKGVKLSVTDGIITTRLVPSNFFVQNLDVVRLGVQSISPLRVSLQLANALQAQDTITIVFGTQYADNSNTLPLCTLRDINTFRTPILTQCSYSPTNRAYTLTLLSGISSGKYFIEITHLHGDIATNGILFPNKMDLEVRVQTRTGSLISQDFIHLAPQPARFKQLNIVQRNRIGSSISQFDLTFQLPSSVASDASNEEKFLVLEFPTSIYDSDLGVLASFNADSISYFNGVFIPSVISSSLGSNINATLHEGNNADPALVIVPLSQSISTTVKELSLAYIKNPAANKGLSFKVSIIKLASTVTNGVARLQSTILYQTSYTNYYNTLLEDTLDQIPQLTVAFSPLNPLQTTTMTLSGKNYGTEVNTNSKIYVKLTKEAKGFDYNNINAITCSGYEVQWHKKGYIFFLIPFNNKGTTPTITCSGLKLGYEVEDLVIETGIHKEDYRKVMASSASQTMIPANGVPGDVVSVSRVGDNSVTVFSVNLYKITYNPGNFNIEAGGYIVLEIPTGFEIVADRLKDVVIRGLKDRNSEETLSVVSASLTEDGKNIKISGYETYEESDGNIEIEVYLKNIKAGQFQFILKFFGKNNKQIAQSSLENSQRVTIPQSKGLTKTLSFKTYKSDAIDIFAEEQYPLIFQIQIRNALRFSTGGEMSVVMPSTFTKPTSHQYICKYSSDYGNYWIRSPCNFQSSTFTIPIVEGFDLEVRDTILIMVTTNSPNITTSGLFRPSDPILHTFNLRTRRNTQGFESAFIPFVVFPNPDIVANVKWHTLGAQENSIIEVSFTANQNIQPNDFFVIELTMYDEIYLLFPYYAGNTELEKRLLGNCADDPLIPSLSQTAELECFIHKGKSSATRPAEIVIHLKNGVSQGSEVRFYIANITNPRAALKGGYIMNIMRPCRDDGLGCPILRNRDYISLVSASSPAMKAMNVPTLEQNKEDLFEDKVRTTYRLSLGYSVPSSDALVFKMSTLQVPITTECESENGMCVHFPHLGWTLFKPTSTFRTGSVTISLDNAIFYDRTNTTKFSVEVWTNTRIQEIYTSNHPAYQLMVSPLNTISTQADIAIQRIVRNFDNILELSMTGIWRTELVSRIIVNIPQSYAPIDDYCRAGVNLGNISDPKYIEFACQKVAGTQRQVLIVINEPWKQEYRDYRVLLYYRGFLPNNESLIGETLPAVITSYASMTTNWVIDENTDYRFIIDPEPTPFVRNTSFNLKSFLDRQAELSEFVQIYGAIWPQTPYNASDPSKQITHVLFQIDNLFVYPSLKYMKCDTKAIFAEVFTCTLIRNQGRTEILSALPKGYQHSPFLFLVTNIEENLLFQAPDIEGSFLYNITYLNAQGQPVEKAMSYISINGDYVSKFIAEPLLRDPLVTTLYDIQFDTTRRPIPQGYKKTGQAASTQIVLLFETYDSSFPYDLGSGLVNDSEISCIPVEGIKVSDDRVLTCRLIHGTQSVDAQIIITGYETIAANSQVKIFLDQIDTLSVDKTAKIKMEIRSSYAGSDAHYIYYNSFDTFPQRPTTPIAKSPVAMTIEPPTSTTLRERSSLSFTFTITASLAANEDFIIIEFPDYFYEQDVDYSNVEISITSPVRNSVGYVMPKRNVIYIQPTASLPVGTVTISIENLPAPSYHIDQELTFTVKTVVGNKVFDVFTNNIDYKSTICDLFENIQVIPSSNFTRINENTYQISFTVLHTIPSTGSLAIIFDSNLYKLRPSNPQCDLVKGFSPQATCGFELYSQQLIRISLNGVALVSGTEVTVNILNINNPIDDSKAPAITIQSYFDAEYGTSKTICSKDVTLPVFMPTEILQCPVEIEPVIKNTNELTDYLVKLLCPAALRNYTTIEIQFPSGFESSFETNPSCSINGNYMLGQCYLVARTTKIRMLVSKPDDEQTPIIVRIRNVRNPSLPGTYGPFGLNLYQYEILFASLNSENSVSQVEIVLNQQLEKDKNIMSLAISPKNYGEKASYYFRIVGLNLIKEPQEIHIKFDQAFSQNLGPRLECGTFTPKEHFGDSYALNYDEISNLESFNCSVIDAYVLRIELLPTANLLNMKDWFFFVNNIINPNIDSMVPQTQSMRAYSFTLTVLKDKIASVISKNDIPINFNLPPSLLQVTNVSSTDYNVLVTANYTFTLSATTDLPNSNTDKDYELMLTLPASQYPDSIDRSQVTYSFPHYPEIQYESPATNFKNLIFFQGFYPDLKSLGPFDLSLNYILNPEIPSQCGVTPSNTTLNYRIEYVSRTHGYVYSRTYSIMDQNNCMEIGKLRGEISVIAPQLFRQGLVYTIYLEIDEPTTGLSLTPMSNSFIFEPLTISFDDYNAQVISVKVYVPRNVPIGNYTIQWKKEEALTPPRYLEIKDTVVTVMEGDSFSSVIPLPKVRIEEIFYLWEGQLPQALAISIDQAPAEELILLIQTQYPDHKLQGSIDDSVYSEFPLIMRFSRGESLKKIYIFADEGARDNVLVYSLAGTDSFAYDQNIEETPLTIKSKPPQGLFKISLIEEVAVLENSAQFRVSLSELGTIFFLALTKSTFVPQDTHLISGEVLEIDSKFYQSGNIVINHIESGSPISGLIELSNLRSQTDYQLYFLARNNFGEYSQIMRFEFATLKVSTGASIFIRTREVVNTSVLINALGIVLSIPADRIIIQAVKINPLERSNNTNNTLNSLGDNNELYEMFEGQLSSYKFGIIPDPYNNSPTPIQIANKLLTQEKLDEFTSLVPNFAVNIGIRITPILGNFPQVILAPKVEEIGYYTVKISLELIDAGKVYGIAVPKSWEESSISTSFQISQGLLANNSKLDESYFNMTITDDNGYVVLVFDELRDFVEYDIYITAGNDNPYEPVDLIKDNEIMTLSVKTLKNPNVGTMDDANRLYIEFYEIEENSSKRIQSLILLMISLLSVILCL